MLNIFISDLGRYNAGELTGKWYDMETEEGREEAAQAVADIEENGSGEYFISDYESDGLKIGEHTPIETVAEIGGILESEDPDLHYMISDVNGYNGAFDYLIAYDMDSLDDFMSGQDAHFIACRVYFGDFNPTDDYFNFDGYGNLKSYNEREYVAALEDEAAAIYREWFEINHGITL